MTRSTEYVNIRVKWHGGMRWGKFPFWMSDQAVIRETMDALGSLGPNDPSGFTVEREDEFHQ